MSESSSAPLPVLLIHHAAGCASDWDEIAARLAEQTRVVAIDLPGHGSRPGPALESVEAMAAFTAGVVREAGGGPFVVAGHSMGGAVAVQMALDHRDLVAGLVLVSTGARLRVAKALIDLIRERFRDFGQQMVAMGASPSCDPEVLRRWVLRPWPVAPETALVDFLACDRFDVRGRLAEVSVPTTILVGEDDLMTPVKRSQELEKAIAGAQLRILPRTGHLLIWERPESVVEAAVSMACRAVS